MGRRSGEKERYWRRHVNARAASGLGVRAYCRRERLSEASFYAWRRELRRRGVAGRRSGPAGMPTSARTERGPGAEHHSNTAGGAGQFLPVKIAAGREPTIEVALPRGIVVRVWPGAPAALWRDLLAVLLPSADDAQRHARAEAR